MAELRIFAPPSIVIEFILSPAPEPAVIFILPTAFVPVTAPPIVSVFAAFTPAAALAILNAIAWLFSDAFLVFEVIIISAPDPDTV